MGEKKVGKDAKMSYKNHIINFIVLFPLVVNTSTNFTSHPREKLPAITTAVGRHVLDATVRILMFPTDSLEALGVKAGQRMSIEEARSRGDVTFRYELGLGTLISHNGEIMLYTHDHWGCLDNLGMVQFYNAEKDLLLELDGETFKNLIRYRDGGTMILEDPTEEAQPNYLAALVWASRAKSSSPLVPASFGAVKNLREGEIVIIARTGRDDQVAVELIQATVVSIQDRWGELVFELRNENGETILPGDSGGGIWLNGKVVGNMWKSQYTYAWDWGALRPEKKWMETSYAAVLPDQVDTVIPIGIKSESGENAKDQESLPKSFYTIYFWTTDGVCREHIGVAIQGNALLSSNHLLPKRINPGDVSRIQMKNAYGDVYESANPADFLIRQEPGYTILVFKNEVIPEDSIAKIGDVDSLVVGTKAYQAVTNGAPAGIYSTEISGAITVLSIGLGEYQGVTIFPDRTVTGDSGSPLYVNGVVYGVNNSGNGIYGAITDPGGVYQMIDGLSGQLNPLKMAYASGQSN